MYISYNVVDGNEYATVVRSVRDGARVTKEDRVYLGRVVDRARGVYRSKARGLFSYDLATGEFGPAPEGVEGPRGRNARAARPTPAVSFGDAFPPGSLLRPGGLTACADACGHAEPDTARARPASCVPAGLANRHAGDWWRPPTRGSPAPGPGWPPRGPASAWPTSAARTPSAASWASTWPSSAGGGRRARRRHPRRPRGAVRLLPPSRHGRRQPRRPGRRGGPPHLRRAERRGPAPLLPPRRRQRDRREHGHPHHRRARGDGRGHRARRPRRRVPRERERRRADGREGAHPREDGAQPRGPRGGGRRAPRRARGQGERGHARRQARVRQVRPRGDRLQGRPQGLRLPVPRLGHAPRARARAARRAAEGGLSGAGAHGPMASRGMFVLAGTRRIARGRPLPLCHARGRVERVFEIARQGGRALPVCVRSEVLSGTWSLSHSGPARLRAERGDPRGAPAHVPRGHRGDQDDVGRAGLAQDLAHGRVDAGDPARAARDRVRRAAGHHRAREEDERGARDLRDQVPGHHRAASCGLRKCRGLRLVLRSS